MFFRGHNFVFIVHLLAVQMSVNSGLASPSQETT